jgi:uncharacterized membrane protein YbhN (UPF0104 family)
MSGSRRRRRLLVAGKALAGIGLLAVLAWRVDLTQVGARLAAVAPWPLAATLGVFAVGVALQAWRWWILLRFWRIETGLGNLVRLLLGAGALNLVLPGNLGGDVYRVVGVRGEAAGWLPSAGLVVLERYCGLVATLGMALPALIAGGFARRQPGLALAVAGLSALLLAPLPLVANRRAAAAAGAGLRRAGLERAAAAAEAGAAAVRAFIAAPRAVIGVLALSAAMKACVAAILVLLGAGLGLELSWIDVLVFLPLHTVVSALPFTLNGLGVREANLVAFFTRLGLTSEQAASLALLHLLFLVATALPGAVLLVGWRSRAAGASAP